MINDLNKLTIEDHRVFQSTDGQWLHNSTQGLDASPVHSNGMTAYFRDLERHLIQRIEEADAVIGCVAWLTNKAILDVLSKKDPVALVVQKEDFLRPDIGSGRGWKNDLRSRYDRLTCTWERYHFPGIVSSLSVCYDPTMDPVRCVGNYNRAKYPAFPRMHHKFVVFCRCLPEDTRHDSDANEEYLPPCLDPYAVWTGSFNFTENASRSLENAMYITDAQIVSAYVDEWAQIEALSEPLDWETDWAAPQWRIGT